MLGESYIMQYAHLDRCTRTHTYTYIDKNTVFGIFQHISGISIVRQLHARNCCDYLQVKQVTKASVGGSE